MAESNPPFELEERTFQFALRVRQCVNGHPWSKSQWKDLDQVLRSSGSVAANYSEANNAFSKKDFAHRIGVAKKEAGESKLWLRLLGCTSTAKDAKDELRSLYQEADELVRIFSKIHKSSSEG